MQRGSLPLGHVPGQSERKVVVRRASIAAERERTSAAPRSSVTSTGALRRNSVCVGSNGSPSISAGAGASAAGEAWLCDVRSALAPEGRGLSLSRQQDLVRLVATAKEGARRVAADTQRLLSESAAAERDAAAAAEAAAAEAQAASAAERRRQDLEELCATLQREVAADVKACEAASAETARLAEALHEAQASCEAVCRSASEYEERLANEVAAVRQQVLWQTGLSMRLASQCMRETALAHRRRELFCSLLARQQTCASLTGGPNYALALVALRGWFFVRQARLEDERRRLLEELDVAQTVQTYWPPLPEVQIVTVAEFSTAAGVASSNGSSHKVGALGASAHRLEHVLAELQKMPTRGPAPSARVGCSSPQLADVRRELNCRADIAGGRRIERLRRELLEQVG